jgi:hypothetical protein
MRLVDVGLLSGTAGLAGVSRNLRAAHARFFFLRHTSLLRGVIRPSSLLAKTEGPELLWWLRFANVASEIPVFQF